MLSIVNLPYVVAMALIIIGCGFFTIGLLTFLADVKSKLQQMYMPNMDGYTATRRIRAIDRPDAAAIPILAVTTNTYPEDVKEAFSAGMNGHLPKPVDVGQALQTLSTLLSREVRNP